ncbi:MAG TPA: histidine kinase dimerization/phospho-acceptor domain-containing protein [Novosphingobium sp.]|nr:histidine kinase dimerization/phospho-acceptor domain-containing protein [Novosphingobium sp.]
MHYDDRLATVLRQPHAGPTIARVQYRQLLDLLGTLPRGASSPTIEAGYRLLSQLSSAIPANERRAMIQDPALRLRDLRLLALLAEAEPPVATAAIMAAQLGEQGWLELVPALPVRARGILRHRRGLGPKVERLLEKLGIGDRGLPPSEARGAEAQAAEARAAKVPAEDAPAAGAPVPEARIPVLVAVPRRDVPEPHPVGPIGAIVRRIEEFRKSREPSGKSPAPRLPLGDNENDAGWIVLRSVDFSTDTHGRVTWADAAAAPMIVGMALASRPEDGAAGASPSLLRALRHRQPVTAGELAIEGAPAISGAWLADAAPRFDEASGRFLGYVGRLRRAPGQRHDEGDGGGDGGAAPSEADAMRQILHELKTPLTAIQGGAEIIQQSLFGPVPHEYRALAATIASDAATILAGFDELERLVKLDAGAIVPEPGESDLGQVVTGVVAQLQAHTDPRNSGFAVASASGDLLVALDRGELERMVWRFLAALAGAAAPGEVLKLTCAGGGGAVRLSARLPAALAALDDDALFQARAEGRQHALSAGMFGLGFTLRLVAAEALAAAGSLTRNDDGLELTMPSLTRSTGGLSDTG